MAPASRTLQEGDSAFLLKAAPRILEGSKVATTTANRLNENGIDAARFARIFGERGGELVVSGYKFKLIDADPDTPDNFGVLVRVLETQSGGAERRSPS